MAERSKHISSSFEAALYSVEETVEALHEVVRASKAAAPASSLLATKVTMNKSKYATG